MDSTLACCSLLLAIVLLYDLPAAYGTAVSATRLRCGRGWLEVTVQLELLGVGAQALRRGGLYLGEPACHATGEGEGGSLVLLYNLGACGTQASVENDDIVYTNYLHYEPATRSNIVRVHRASVFLECRYHRKHNVTSGDVAPTWLPYTSERVVQQRLPFRLRAVSDDWLSDYSGPYRQGDDVRVEASVDLGPHLDFLLFIDECLAVPFPSPDEPNAEILIQNHGCLKIQNGLNPGHFQARLRPDRLRFSFKAFGFQQNSSSQVYLRCNLKVAEQTTSSNAVDKACTYFPEGWMSPDGNNHVCSCCSNLCSSSAPAKAAPLPLGIVVSGYVGLGPLTVSGDQTDHPAVDKRDLLRFGRAHDHVDSSGAAEETAVTTAAVVLPLAVTVLVAGTLAWRRRKLPLPRALIPACWRI
ncbi:zona pellucida sperm-binding protein 3-like [Lethenteron reissneri]|uniref:zona pellucida sperm-binding protein 3-like n=1 Tax=Lethenteron reissneri TaxID=7753 RepID=UPI002AB68C03|nr:zona pellucida sperm-binding protein 3-like [Lethenteron reissneri]